MRVLEEKNRVIINGVKDFEPKHIFECGQCFRWEVEEDGSYTGVAFGKVINVKKEEDILLLDNTNLGEYESIWREYFDMDRDYSKLKNSLRNIDEHMEASVDFGHGIRILEQEPWEMLISFIISARNRIPMIKKCIKNISRAYGKSLGIYRGKEWFAFPTPSELSKASVEELATLSTGYRNKYIYETTKKVIEENIDVSAIINMTTEEGREKLLEFQGVGPKVADCILLFGMKKKEVFPVDVWVKRVMEEIYLKEEVKNLKLINQAGIEKFKEDAGFAQQYLFYYARENGIGK